MSDTEPKLAAGRSCANCTMCCKVLTIPELEKPGDQWCKHCLVGKGCGIYASRPATCAGFFCLYLLDGVIGEHWKPAHSRMVLTSDEAGVYVHVDPARSDAWRKEPYYSDLKTWSARFVQKNVMTLVFVGDSLTAILPDRDKHMGRQNVRNSLRLLKAHGPRGPVYDVEVYDRDTGKAVLP